MANVISSILILTLWLFSILFPFFMTDNEKYKIKEKDNSLSQARSKSHFLRQ